MPAQSYRPNTPHVIHETIEGEVILVNLQNGSYYSTDETGTFIWNHLESGVSTERLMSFVLAEYSGEPDALREGVTNLLAQLAQEGLVVPADAAPDLDSGPGPTNAGTEKRAFVLPSLQKYTEMEDLLLLDPIHDVDDSGWPSRFPDKPAQ